MSDEMIDAVALARSMSLDDHQKTANQYFRSISNPWQYHLRKPYAEVSECCHILAGISSILRAAHILPGHRVLDLGCGTGWLSLILSYLRCEVVGLDVSAAALEMAATALTSHPARSELNVRFQVFDGRHLPFEDNSFDRTICFDAFHHVPDQHFAIGELGRILRAGGIAVFHEPGPAHSLSPQSQYEMKNYRVIEGDIKVEELWDTAIRSGFVAIEMIINSQKPLLYTLDDFNTAISMKHSEQFYAHLGHSIVEDFVDKRIFMLKKGGVEAFDSRAKTALKGEIIVNKLTFDQKTRTVATELILKNTGAVTWRPSGPELGSVNVGTRLFYANGAILDRDYSRHEVLTEAIRPGDEIQLNIEFHVRYDVRQFVIEFDLVSELVTWFSEIGSSMPRVSVGG